MRWRRAVAASVIMGSVLAGLTFAPWVMISIPTSQEVLGPRIDWPKTSYAEVRGYLYNAEGDHGVPIIEDGVLHKSVVDRNGVRLDASQVERLLDSVARPHSEPSVRAACYDPRHAFVFFDERRQPVAHVEICFSCIGFNTSPKVTHSVGYTELRQLCQDLSLPVFGGRDERQQYLDYADRHAPKGPPQ